MRARVKGLLAADWWLSDKAGQTIGVERSPDGRIVEAGTDLVLMDSEIDGLLPDDPQAFAELLRAYYGDSARFEYDGERVRVFVALGMEHLPRPLDFVAIANDGTAWLKPLPGGCRNCGSRTFSETYSLDKDGYKVDAHLNCMHCGAEVKR